MNKKIIVAVDGTAGSGKTATFNAVAKKIGYEFIDTGLMYRAFTLLCIELKIDFTNKEQIIDALNIFDFSVKNSKPHLNGKEVEKRIQENDIVEFINYVTPIPEVRKFMIKAQRAMVTGGGYIEIGRDITTVVLPDADLKIYLDSSVEARAKRRFNQNERLGIKNNNFEEIKNSIINRDEQDFKNGLKKADDAWLIDNSNIPIQDVVNMVIDKIKELEGK
ncbi:(d)CMP kinase [Mesoplasma coleopterae]|uniref:Cytidylate kinase n=1 Tax=Mesoplasma coleopterae TaxID=324078 RepID=A0A2K8P3M3_9MOLU|nr:(d)CMP kinase [Mesoplasma coleopterae]ATZ20730.1 cytidylate kinase [Mesoplasma coleopterae]AVN62241.1 cytidylate kinase [Mesoplasma coleopterae]AVN62909.1 cytidylate kinase [Mesoplasma coleopterae]